MLEAMCSEPFHFARQRRCEDLGISIGIVGLSGLTDTFIQDNEEETITMAWAGECIALPGVVSELRRNGHHLIDDARDWMLHLYEERGLAAVPSLNGAFSAVFIDKRSRDILLAIDRYGMGRVYYHETPDAFYFASEAKALIRALPELRRFDDRGVLEYLTYGYPLEDRTLFRGIRLVPAAACWRLGPGRRVRDSYFEPAEWAAQPPLTTAQCEQQTAAVLADILPQYCEGNLGLSLTGGLDTRLIVAFWPGDVRLPPCYTFDGPTGATYDTDTAAAVAHSTGMPHTVLRLGFDFFRNFQYWADLAVYASDGALGVTGAHEVYLNRKAREIAPIRLTGNFGSEVLRDAASRKRTTLSSKLFSDGFRTRYIELASAPSADESNAVAYAAFTDIPRRLHGMMAATQRYVRFRTPYLDNRLVALAYQAPTATPFSADATLRLLAKTSATLSTIATDMGVQGADGGPQARWNRVARKVSFKIDYVFNEGMFGPFGVLDPITWTVGHRSGIIGRHKYLHYRYWLRKELSQYVYSRLLSRRVRQGPFWNRKFLEVIASGHLRGTANWSHEIGVVLTLDAVERTLFDEPVTVS